jgi:hypothetical protein
MFKELVVATVFLGWLLVLTAAVFYRRPRALRTFGSVTPSSTDARSRESV